MFASFSFSASSWGVKVWFGRKVERRAKSTSVGVCRREDVRVKMFSGENGGRVETMKRRAERKRMLRERWTGGRRGMGFEGAEEVEAAARRDL